MPKVTKKEPKKATKKASKKVSKKSKYKDLKTIEKTFLDMDNDKGKLGLSLVEEANFLGETLELLKEKIKEEGVVTEMCQGNYSIDRESPASKSYNTCIKNYQSLIKQITELLPVEAVKLPEDAFDEFNS